MVSGQLIIIILFTGTSDVDCVEWRRRWLVAKDSADK